MNNVRDRIGSLAHHNDLLKPQLPTVVIPHYNNQRSLACESKLFFLYSLVVEGKKHSNPEKNGRKPNLVSIDAEFSYRPTYPKSSKILNREKIL